MLLLSAPPASEVVRFVGLERLHFEAFSDLGEIADYCAPAVQSLLPASLPEPKEPIVDPEGQELPFCDRLAVADHSLPLPTGEVLLREVRDYSHPRIHRQYWCLYRGGRRTDCWYFAPIPDRAEGKMLSPMFFEGAMSPRENELVVQVSGRMVRPQGAFSMHRAELVFAARGNEIELQYVLRRFAVYQGYDRYEPRGDDFEVVVPRPMVAWEHRADVAGSPVLLERRIDDVPEAAFERCGADEAFDGPRDQVEELVHCLTAEGAAVSHRKLDEPSFLERGWKRP